LQPFLATFEVNVVGAHPKETDFLMVWPQDTEQVWRKSSKPKPEPHPA
jgi:hypothetical protein